MATELERMLAIPLAQAVEEQSRIIAAWKEFEIFYPPPKWYQPAVDALETYEEQNRPRVNY